MGSRCCSILVLVSPTDALPPAQHALQPAAAAARVPSAPSSSYTKVGGAFLAGVHGNISQQYSSMGFQGQPSPSQLAAFNTNAAAASTATRDARKDEICQQMEALELEYSTLI